MGMGSQPHMLQQTQQALAGKAEVMRAVPEVQVFQRAQAGIEKGGVPQIGHGRLSRKVDAAGRGPGQSGYHAQQGAFARAVAAGQQGNAGRCKAAMHVAQDHPRPVHLGKMFHLQHVLRLLLPFPAFSRFRCGRANAASRACTRGKAT